MFGIGKCAYVCSHECPKFVTFDNECRLVSKLVFKYWTWMWHSLHHHVDRKAAKMSKSAEAQKTATSRWIFCSLTCGRFGCCGLVDVLMFRRCSSVSKQGRFSCRCLDRTWKLAYLHLVLADKATPEQQHPSTFSATIPFASNQTLRACLGYVFGNTKQSWQKNKNKKKARR